LGQYVAGIFIKTKKAIFFRNEPNHLPQAAPERFTPKKKEQPTWRNPSELLPVAAYETFFGNVI
jgi:hypothetical protein